MHSVLPKYAQGSATSGSASQMCIVCHWYVLCRSDTLIRIVSPSIVLQIAAYRSKFTYNPRVGMTMLVTGPISQVSARRAKKTSLKFHQYILNLPKLTTSLPESFYPLG
ncbi:hypothetical protein FOTG_13496 [Fusarium oxysporum f. sp. vasinfectum 25433]|uniref:Uncharacterized protein n=1 Tax=Fusarium oxysporum f. sp. vasinfectum 25433 TaxID=1089449 RepID=X0KXT1_FUSOX|nr:hypothetical protein FOTG_13496 [Fusarium oxysporum f. sp. vasinfectum 25433]